MSKKKTKPRRAGAGVPRARLDQAEELIAHRRWEEAEQTLKRLVQSNPRNIEAWAMLIDVYGAQKNTMGLWEATDRLVTLEPDEPENWFNATMACAANQLLFSVLHHADHFLERWPDHPLADKVREVRDATQKASDDVLASGTTTPGATPDDLMLYEIAQMAFNRGDYARGEQIAREAMQRLPDAVAPLNNLTLAMMLQCRFDRAIEIARQVLARDPDNVHALSNLVQCLVRTGARDEARAVAARLRAQQPAAVSLYAKQMEALIVLGDDAAVCEVYAAAERAGALDKVRLPMPFHLAAVAFARQGDRRQAERLWQRALKLDPSFKLARDNLADLKKPAGERSGAFPFSFGQWVSREWIEATHGAVVRGQKSAAAGRREMERVLERHPHLRAAVPLLLERGDPEGRALALLIAKTTQLPELVDFALGQNGTDQERMEAAQVAVEAGLLARDAPIPLYIKGKQQELRLMNYEITSEPSPPSLPPKAQDLLERGHEALAKGRAKDAEVLIREALAIVPDDPALLNHLVGALQLQGRKAEATALIREMGERFPDYLFARTAMAHLCVQEGHLEEAREWLTPLFQQERFHISEYAALCLAQVELLLAEGHAEQARSVIDVWSQIDPDNPNILPLRVRVRRAQKRQWW